jgi:hypothetical protein
MKRLIMILAIAVAANFAGFGIQAASAIDAHHPTAQTNKAKKAKAAPKKTKRVKTSGMNMQCPMMTGHMMKRHMMQHGKTMTCPMMRGHRMGTMHKH